MFVRNYMASFVMISLVEMKLCVIISFYKYFISMCMNTFLLKDKNYVIFCQQLIWKCREEKLCVFKIRNFYLRIIRKRFSYFYLSLIMELVNAPVVSFSEGKYDDSFSTFWRRIKVLEALIDAVSLDMSPVYISAMIKHLPKAAIVFNNFHVNNISNDRISEFSW